MIRVLFFVAFVGAFGMLNYYWYSTPITTNPLEVGDGAASQELVSELKTGSTADVKTFAVSDVAHTYSRPLFEESRRKWQPPKKEIKPVAVKVETLKPVAREPEEPLRITLKGIAILPESKTVLVEDHKNDTVRWLKTSSYVQGWQIEKITQGSVTFLKADERIDVKLHKPGAAPDG